MIFYIQILERVISADSSQHVCVTCSKSRKNVGSFPQKRLVRREEKLSVFERKHEKRRVYTRRIVILYLREQTSSLHRKKKKGTLAGSLKINADSRTAGKRNSLGALKEIEALFRLVELLELVVNRPGRSQSS